MKQIVLFRHDGNEIKYYQDTNLGTGMPQETKDLKLAYKFCTLETAAYYSACFVNVAKFYHLPVVEYQIKELAPVPDEEKKYTFFISVLIENEKRANEFVLDVCRQNFWGTFEDARRYTEKLITGTPGILNEAKIESLRDGIGSLTFVEETRWDPFQHTSCYATL